MCRLKSLSIAALVLVLVGVAAFAQRRGASSQTPTEIQVRVSYEDERPVEQQLQVDLLNDQGIPLLQTVSDSEGRAVFHISGGGVFGPGSPALARDDPFRCDGCRPQRPYGDDMVHIPRKTEATTTTSGSAAMTTANELKIPNDAKKSFTKGMDALRHQDYPKAAELFEKATRRIRSTMPPTITSASHSCGWRNRQSARSVRARRRAERQERRRRP